jgi:lipoprotein-anchoring transpeptidase ErfK/SrfK
MKKAWLWLAALLAVAPVTGVVHSTPAAAREVVNFNGAYGAGTIVIHTNERRLYYVLGGGQALVYPVGVGTAGMQWQGTTIISGKYLHPDWQPPEIIRREKPSLPAVIRGGSPKNPMGVAAMTLYGGEYAIHGTNADSSVGGFVSHGCIRMHNADIMDLWNRVGIGTTVVVTR